jgi:FkbM family methyltransferase
MKRRLRRLLARLPRSSRLAVLSVYATFRARALCRVLQDGAIFERRYRRTRLFAPLPTGPTPAESERTTHDIFCWGYMPRSGDFVVDLGAGVGTEASTFAGLVGHDGLVLAVEAHPLTFECLERVVRANGLQNVATENVAILDSRATVSMTDDVDSWIGNSVVSSEGPGTVKVDAIALPELLERHGGTRRRISLLKMNIEGAELPALRGAGDVLDLVDNLAVSCHDFKARRTGDPRFRTAEAVTELLEERGFIVARRADPREYVADVVYASRRAEQSARS